MSERVVTVLVWYWVVSAEGFRGGCEGRRSCEVFCLCVLGAILRSEVVLDGYVYVFAVIFFFCWDFRSGFRVFFLYVVF